MTFYWFQNFYLKIYQKLKFQKKLKDFFTIKKNTYLFSDFFVIYNNIGLVVYGLTLLRMYAPIHRYPKNDCP